MRSRSVALLLAIVGSALAPLGAAEAAVLIEAKMAGQALRLVVDRTQERVLITAGDTRALFDLAAGLIYLQRPGEPASRVHARFRPGHDEPPPYRVERFGPGPILAGNASTYYVLFDQDRVCAEAMLSGWMRPFVDPAVRAIAMLERASRPAGGDACAAIPFTTYAAAGWPLLTGKIDRPSFVTTRIEFDYRPAADELAPPASSRELPIEELSAWIALPPS
jgi:hypothetical protein